MSSSDPVCCWLCDAHAGYGPLGLCDKCREVLRRDVSYPPPPNATLHATGTLPEDIPDTVRT